jgi:hypothetical protein
MYKEKCVVVNDMYLAEIFKGNDYIASPYNLNGTPLLILTWMKSPGLTLLC